MKSRLKSGFAAVFKPLAIGRMKLRTKLLLTMLLEIALIISAVGLYAYRGSKNEIEGLARDLLRARTEFAYALCEKYHVHYGRPDPALVAQISQEFSKVRIATDGYIVAIDNSPSNNKGRLLIHPTDVGLNLNNSDYPHIQRIINRIDSTGQRDRFAAYDEYEQGTHARGRQGEFKIAYYMYFKPWDWILLSSAYESDLLASAENVRHRTIEIIAAMVVLAIFVLTFSLRRILAPLRQLTAKTQEVSRGNFDATFETKTRDEIGELAQSFNSMLAAIKTNLRINQEFEIARRMQTEMLPEEPPELPGVRLQVRTQPATVVGGDFYDFVKLNERQFAVIVGDVSGKGISGAMVVSAARSALRYAAEERRRPGEILQSANRRLTLDLQKNMFIAVFIGIFDVMRNELIYSNAGQMLPVLCRDGRAELLPAPLSGERLPLGIKTPIHYGQHEIALLPGDLLLFYTDGIVDMMNESFEPYSFERLLNSVAAHAALPLKDLITALIHDAEVFAGTGEHFDDVTILALRYESVTAGVPELAGGEADYFVENGRIDHTTKLQIPASTGYEKIAMDAAAALAGELGFSDERIADIRTAVSEACLNAMEHGNKLNANTSVEVLLNAAPENLTIQILDSGSGFPPEAVQVPQIDLRIQGQEKSRGLGRFLIEQLVDHVDYKVIPNLGHVITMIVKRN